ncbi:DUF1178 family protein [Pararhizobium mangrovi]|uniref:DUF1178 family protein n=1 Tax=Pararhizobium mangrovi TaxID=2590452 RepID=A0A506U7R1_9HYPH|nr:DUF1178 family protein [Pararhizobium mangrovi]TPW28649.1 DUF1178 family protein [Pararhizobium mangrovi]
MIRFSLTCEKAHGFEGWFGSNADFEAQNTRDLVACPHCGSTGISKALMAPALAKGGQTPVATSDGKVAEGEAGKASLAMTAEQKQAFARFRDAVRAVRANTEDVGTRFPEEARRIHHGEAESRGIMGKANSDEARSLIEEGITIAPLPDIDEDYN